MFLVELLKEILGVTIFKTWIVEENAEKLTLYFQSPLSQC